MKPSCVRRLYIQTRKLLVTKWKPKCTACQSGDVEILDFISIPAYWKCRTCKNEFEYEE